MDQMQLTQDLVMFVDRDKESVAYDLVREGYIASVDQLGLITTMRKKLEDYRNLIYRWAVWLKQNLMPDFAPQRSRPVWTRPDRKGKRKRSEKTTSLQAGESQSLDRLYQNRENRENKKLISN